MLSKTAQEILGKGKKEESERKEVGKSYNMGNNDFEHNKAKVTQSPKWFQPERALRGELILPLVL